MVSARSAALAAMVLELAPPSAGAAVRVGVGVPGAAGAGAAACAGAAGGAGVAVEAEAGVAGGAEAEDSAAGTGAALGYSWESPVSTSSSKRRSGVICDGTLFTTQTTKPFSSIL